MINLDNIWKEYGRGDERMEALKGVSGDFKRGSMYAIVGPSGAGKTTLLKIIGGLLEPTKGSVSIDGVDLYLLPERKRTELRKDFFGYIFQDYALLEDETAYYNIAIPFDYRKIKRPERKIQIQTVAHNLGIEKILSKKVSKLSGGEKQRVAIARGLVVDAPVILADEPTGALDKENRVNLMHIMSREAHEKNKVSIIVTHDLEVAYQCDYQINVRDGMRLEK